MNLYWFSITVTYDEGKFIFRVAARNISEAIKSVMEAEKCPVSSIIRAVKGKRIGKYER